MSTARASSGTGGARGAESTDGYVREGGKVEEPEASRTASRRPDEHSGASGHGAATGRAAPEMDAEVAALLDELTLGADAAETAEANLRPVLVLLDFNGTLVHKSEVKAGRGKAAQPVYGCDRTKMFPVRFNCFHIRPGARELLAILVNDPRCTVAVYTAKLRRNVDPVVSALDNHLSRGHYDPVYVSGADSTVTSHTAMGASMLDLFDQQYNAHDPEGEKEWSTKRDLKLVWGSRKCRTAGFDATNTVLIESDSFKARDCMDNTVLVPEYTQEDVTAWRTDKGQTLKRLATWLEDNIFTPMQKPGAMAPDVRALLKKAPALK